MSLAMESDRSRDVQDEPRRKEHVEKYLRDTERYYVEDMGKRFGDLVPPERIQALRDLPMELQERPEFDASYHQAGGEVRPDEKVLGFSTGSMRPAHVSLDHLQIPKTIIHEDLHRLSAPNLREVVGPELEEGITEDLAIDVLGTEPVEGLPRCYPEGRQAAHDLREVCGDAVERTYFQGSDDLQRTLEERYGEGALDRIRQSLRDLPEEMA